MSTSNNASKDRYPPEFGVHTSHLDAARKTGNVMWFAQPDTAFLRPWPPPAAVKGIGAGLWSSCRPGHGCGSGIGWGTDVTERAAVDSLAAATDIQHAPTSVKMTTRPIEIR